MRVFLLVGLLALSACQEPKIDEPRIEFPLPPSVLMEPAKPLKTIQDPTEKKEQPQLD